MLCNLYQYIYFTRITTGCDLKPNTLVIYILLHGIKAIRLTTIHIFFSLSLHGSHQFLCWCCSSQPFRVHVYQTWQNQLSIMACSNCSDSKKQKFDGIVTGTNPCPPEFKSNIDDTVTAEVDPRYTTWHQQDQMILSWINNSLSPTVLSTVARFISS